MSDARRHPLPDGVVDAELNRGQLARAFGVSEPTIDRWIGDGMPVLEQGTNGRSYKFLLSACWQWKAERDDAETQATEAGERAVQQMRLALIGGEVGDGERGLSPKQRTELYEAEYKWSQAARARGELAYTAAVDELFEEVFTTIRDAVVSLPDRLQRESGLSNRQVEKAVTACDDALDEAARKIADGIRALRAGSQQANGHDIKLN